MNVILIVSDTLRYDCVGYHGTDPYRWDIRDRPRTPQIDRFAASTALPPSRWSLTALTPARFPRSRCAARC
jgi:arylsulfatase A-like enzyme